MLTGEVLPSTDGWYVELVDARGCVADVAGPFDSRDDADSAAARAEEIADW